VLPLVDFDYHRTIHTNNAHEKEGRSCTIDRGEELKGFVVVGELLVIEMFMVSTLIT